MNKILRMLFVFGIFSLALGACKKNDPVTPTPDPKPAPQPEQPKPQPEQPKPQPEQPKSDIHFDQSTLNIYPSGWGKAVLQNFKGTLVQVGKVEGLSVEIRGNEVLIDSKAYRPGQYVLTFKGGDATYQLTVNHLEVRPTLFNYAVSDLYTGTDLLYANHHVNNSVGGRISVTLAEKEGETVSRFMQFDISSILGDTVEFNLTCKGVRPVKEGQPYAEDGPPYLADGHYERLQGVVVKKPDENSSILSFVAPVSRDGKYIYVVFDTKN